VTVTAKGEGKAPRILGVSGGASSVVYVVEMAQSAGKFNPAAARALGLRPGPKFGLLQQGKSVVLDDRCHNGTLTLWHTPAPF